VPEAQFGFGFGMDDLNIEEAVEEVAHQFAKLHRRR
jgi:hypothetical protein